MFRCAQKCHADICGDAFSVFGPTAGIRRGLARCERPLKESADRLWRCLATPQASAASLHGVQRSAEVRAMPGAVLGASNRSYGDLDAGCRAAAGFWRALGAELAGDAGVAGGAEDVF